MSTTTLSPLDELLRPYEDRPFGIPRDEAAKRQRGISVSKQMNRALGAEANAAQDRLLNLWCLGQVTDAEFSALVVEVAKRKLYEPTDKETARNGR